MFILRRKFNEMQSLISASRKDLEKAEDDAQYLNRKVKERDKMIQRQKEEIEYFKTLISEKSTVIENLENNIEILTNNLSVQKRKKLGL